MALMQGQYLEMEINYGTVFSFVIVKGILQKLMWPFDTGTPPKKKKNYHNTQMTKLIHF